MNLGIFGDSWADTQPDIYHNYEKGILPWGIWLEKKLNANMKCFASSGTGLWWSFDLFKKNYKKFEKIVFVYTNYNRWNGLEGFNKSLAHIREQDQISWVIPEHLEDAKKLIDVWPILYNEELNKYIYQKIFNDVNEMCDKLGIHLVNILAFDYFNPHIDVSKRTGPVFHDLSMVRSHEVSLSPRLRKAVSSSFDITHCHLSPYNNKILSELIIENFTNRQLVMDLSKCERFQYHENHFEYFFEEWDKLEKRH